jgi:hypothetical protein
MEKLPGTIGTEDEIHRSEGYEPDKDWINQRELAGLLGVAPETASRWASRGKLVLFEHGMLGAGKRKYSRRLVREYQELRLGQARARMRQAVGEGRFPGVTA